MGLFIVSIISQSLKKTYWAICRGITDRGSGVSWVWFHQIQVPGYDAKSWKIWPIGYQIAVMSHPIWHPIGHIFQDIASYPETWIWWNWTLIHHYWKLGGQPQHFLWCNHFSSSKFYWHQSNNENNNACERYTENRLVRACMAWDRRRQVEKA